MPLLIFFISKNTQAYTLGRYTEDLIVPNLAVSVQRQKLWTTRAWKYFARDSGTLCVRRVVSSDYKGHGSPLLEWITYSSINLWVIKRTNPFRIFNSVFFTSICGVISITNVPLRLVSDGSYVEWYHSPKQWTYVMQTQIIRLRAVETWLNERWGKQPTRTSPSMRQPKADPQKLVEYFLW